MRLRRTLLAVYAECGGDLVDPGSLDRFDALVRAELGSLPPGTRRAVALALDGGEELTHGALAAALGRWEGRPVSAAAVRQRVSRGGRRLAARLRAVWSAAPPVASPAPARRS